MTLSAGSRLGPYEILAPIGAGGMGEVYRAKDPRLGRDVAIKVLPASFSQDADRLRGSSRRPARPASSTTRKSRRSTTSGRHDGAPYIVTELLEGETLRARLLTGSLRRAQGDRLRRADRAGPRGSAREGDRPPGPEAREPLPDEGTAGSRSSTSDWPSSRRRRARTARPTCRRSRGAPSRASSSGRWATWRPSRCAASPPTGAATSSRSARSCTRCSRGRRRSTATRRPTRSRRS